MRSLRMLVAFGLGLLMAGWVAAAFANGNHGRNSHEDHERPHGPHSEGGNATAGALAGANSDATATAGAISGSHSAAGAVSVSEGGAGGIGEGGSATAQGGTAESSSTSSGGNASIVNNVSLLGERGGSGSASGSGNIASPTITNTHKTVVPRQAPSVFGGAPRSTAPMLKCIGIGASAATGDGAGGGALGWCWIVRPMWFNGQYEEFASMGLKSRAAKAKCMEHIQWKAFGSQAVCEKEIYDWLDQQETLSVSETDLPEDEGEAPTEVVLGKM